MRVGLQMPIFSFAEDGNLQGWLKDVSQAADENNFWGKFTWHEANATRAVERFVNIPTITQIEWEMAASGYAAVSPRHWPGW